MNRKLIILVVGVVAIVAILAVFVVPLLLGAFGPPVDVYARPTPSISEEPLDLLPNQVAGFDFITAELSTFSDGGKGAFGSYGGGIQIGISRYTSEGFAAAQMDLATIAFEDGADSFASADAGEQHWFAATGSGTSIFAWRKGVWLFLVIAPDAALRNQVVEELPF